MVRDLIYEFLKDLNKSKNGIVVKDYINGLVERGILRQDEILGFRMRIYNIIKGKVTNLKDFIVVVNNNPLTLKLDKEYTDEELDNIFKNYGFLTKKIVKKKKYSELVREVRQVFLNTEMKNLIGKADIIPWEDLDIKEKIKYSVDVIKSTLLNYSMINEIVITNDINVFNNKILNSFNYVIFLDESMIECKDELNNEIKKLLDELGLDHIKTELVIN